MDVLRAEPELRKQRTSLLGPHSGAGAEPLEERLLALVGAASLLQGADHRPSPDEARAGDERHLAEGHSQQRRLAAPVAAGDEQALVGAEHEVYGPEPEVAANRDGALQTGDPVTRPFSGLQPELQLPRLVRLVGPIRPLQRPLGETHLAAE